MKLNQLQNDFIAAIFNHDRDTAIKYVTGDETLDAAARLGIYRGSVHGILTQSLGETFPVCKHLLGEEFFDKMCDRFIDQFPPSSPFFSHYGDHLSVFLKDFEPVKTIPFIKDVALLEWTRHKLWQQISPQPFDFSKISSLSEEQQTKLIFQLNRTMRLIDSDYRIDHIWFAHQPESDIELENININEPVKLLLTKSENSLKVADFTTDSEYWRFLDSISHASNITELATLYGESFPQLLNRAIEEGRIESFTCN